MNKLQYASLISLGLLSLVVACVDPDSDSVDIEGPGAQGQGGSGGLNGLPSDVYQAFDTALSIATTQKLVTSMATMTITNTTVINDLLTSPEGALVFGYAIRCAIPKAYTLHYSGVDYEGVGYLLDTADWLTGPLSPAARADLLECVVAHVNPKPIHVPILLSGLSVRDDGQNHKDFDVPEALWIVYIDAGGLPRTQVWPLQAFAEECGPDPWTALQYRVCGKDPVACKLTVRHDLATACVAEGQEYICEGQHAIKTTLSTKSFEQMYDSIICPG